MSIFNAVFALTSLQYQSKRDCEREHMNENNFSPCNFINVLYERKILYGKNTFLASYGSISPPPKKIKNYNG